MALSASTLRTFLPEHDLMSFGGAPAVYHCHHFNLTLDQTIDDALGAEEGRALRFTAARETARQLLLTVAGGAPTPEGRLELALRLFSAMGHGRLTLSGDAKGGTATGEFLHYGFSWAEEYGQRVRRRTPTDAFAAGYAAAALEVAYGLTPETMQATETACVALRAPRCTFELRIGPPAPTMPPVREAEVSANVKPSFDGLHEERVAAIAKGLRDFTAGVKSDERGLVQAFGVFITVHLAGYYNRISYDALAKVLSGRPELVGVLEELLRESGHVCVFNTFGGILASPEWDAMVGPHTGEPLSVILGNLAIARALGFGHWTLADYAPNERLVLQAPATYESVYYLARHGTTSRPVEYFFQGAALAIAHLAHRLDWRARPKLTHEVYASLFFGGKLPWKVNQTKSVVKGDDRSEVVVTRVA